MTATCPFRSWGRRSDRLCEPDCHFHGENGCAIVEPESRGKHCPLDDKGKCSKWECSYAHNCAIGGRKSKDDQKRKDD